MNVLAINPSAPSTLYAGTNKGLYVSWNSGESWSGVSDMRLSHGNVRALAIDPITPSILYTGVDQFGLLKSTDSSMTWNDFNRGLTNADVLVLAIDRSIPMTIYAGIDHGGVASFTIPDKPIVVSIVRAMPTPTIASTVYFIVSFSEEVTGVDTDPPFGDFFLSTSGVTGASITNVYGSGDTYMIAVKTSSGSGSIRLDISATASVQDLAGNSLDNLPFKIGETYTINKIKTFADVPDTHPYYEYIEILYANHLTAGCQTSPLKFCPDQIMNRGQAAVFMLRGNFGSSYLPPTPTHIFKDDWTKGPWAEGWAEGMRAEGFSAGCLTNPLKYCPWEQIPREQAVIFALRLRYGKDYTPPPATGTVFADMTNPTFYATA